MRGRRPEPRNGAIAEVLEIQATAHEAARLLEYGGEFGQRRARQLLGGIIPAASRAQRYLDDKRVA